MFTWLFWGLRSLLPIKLWKIFYWKLCFYSAYIFFLHSKHILVGPYFPLLGWNDCPQNLHLTWQTGFTFRNFNRFLIASLILVSFSVLRALFNRSCANYGLSNPNNSINLYFCLSLGLTCLGSKHRKFAGYLVALSLSTTANLICIPLALYFSP